MRDGARRDVERGPRGEQAQARERAATHAYLKQLDGLFAGKAAGGDGRRLAEAVRAAHGTPGLAAACRAHLEALGAPQDPALASLMLDAGERDVVLAVLEGLVASRRAGGPRLGGGLHAQLELLAEHPDDAVAYAAEDLLASGS